MSRTIQTSNEETFAVMVLNMNILTSVLSALGNAVSPQDMRAIADKIEQHTGRIHETAGWVVADIRAAALLKEGDVGDIRDAMDLSKGATKQ